MFKTGIITDEVSQSLPEAISLAKEFGLDALEIRSVNEKNPFQMTPEDFRAIRRLADDAGLAVCAVGSPFFKCDYFNDREVADHLEGLRRAAEGAHILGTKLIRGFTFWKNDALTPDQIADRFVPVLDLLAAEDITMVLESEPSVNTGNMAALAGFLSLVHHPRLQALYDPGNEICDPKAPPPWPSGYGMLRPWLAHVHIKDMVRTPGGYDPACIGQGQVDFRGIFASLREDGYSGYAVLETHWRLAERMDETLMTRPQGSGFSAGGAPASRRCLEVLRDTYGFGGGGAHG